MLARLRTAGAVLSSLQQSASLGQLTAFRVGLTKSIKSSGALQQACRLATAAKPFSPEHQLVHTPEKLPKLSAQDVFAVVHVGGTQYKVSVNDTIVTQKLEADLGSQIYLHKVLLVGGKDFTLVGAPILGDAIAAVKATVIEQAKTAKVVVYKKKRRKQYQREKGHRQQVSVLKITDITLKSNDA